MEHFNAPFEVKFVDDKPQGYFEGYGAVFGNIDDGGDLIEPGAFAKSLLERERAGRGLPPLYKMHGAMTGNMSEPIGVWEAMSEDSKGLAVKGRLIGLDTEQGKWNYAQLRDGAFKGLSIGYRVMPGGSKSGSGRPGEPRRYLKAVHLREVSLVDDPMNNMARLDYVKAAGLLDLDRFNPRLLEAALRSELNFSSGDAVKVVALVKKHLRDGDDDVPDNPSRDEQAAALAASMKKLASLLQPKG